MGFARRANSYSLEGLLGDVGRAERACREISRLDMQLKALFLRRCLWLGKEVQRRFGVGLVLTPKVVEYLASRKYL